MQNHEYKKAVRLILYKKETGKPTLNYDEAVEEALCFGWIDAKATKRDDESYFIQIWKRNPKSNWSKPNRERVAKLTKADLLQPAGIKMVKPCQRNRYLGCIDRY